MAAREIGPVLTPAAPPDLDLEKAAAQPITDTKYEAQPDEPFSIYTTSQKRWMVIGAAVAAFFSPLTASIYLPALNTLARDLRVSNSQITLTITTYLVSI